MRKGSMQSQRSPSRRGSVRGPWPSKSPPPWSWQAPKRRLFFSNVVERIKLLIGSAFRTHSWEIRGKESSESSERLRFRPRAQIDSNRRQNSRIASYLLSVSDIWNIIEIKSRNSSKEKLLRREIKTESFRWSERERIAEGETLTRSMSDPKRPKENIIAIFLEK